MTKLTHIAFLVYLAICGVTCTYLIYRVAPEHGTKNPMVYLTICSLAGSVSVMAIKVSWVVGSRGVSE
jgi:hypothetical protein